MHFCGITLIFLVLCIRRAVTPEVYKLTLTFATHRSFTFTRVTSPTYILMFRPNICRRTLVENWTVSQVFTVSTYCATANSEISAICFKIRIFIKKFVLLLENFAEKSILIVLICRSTLHEARSIAELFPGRGSFISLLFARQHQGSKSTNYARRDRGSKKPS